MFFTPTARPLRNLGRLRRKRKLVLQSQSNRQSLLYLSTESIQHTSTSSDTLPPPPPPQRQRHQFSPSPSPRQVSRQRRDRLPSLPADFGRNQLLAVSKSTRALLENIVAQFNAPIRYAFAYGSGVFEQDGYKQDGPDAPMLDFIFAVNHPAHWHSVNLSQNPHHYSFHTRLFGSDFISRMQKVGPGIWFNAYVPMNGVKIKYGVTTLDNLCSDLLAWRTLYLAGRMHKPIRIIKDDARVRLTQQVNLTSALRVALLTLPERFDEVELFERVTSISYSGDPRMWLPAENRGKVGNIVRLQKSQFTELYRRLAVGLPSVYWPTNSSTIEQDLSPNTRSSHLKKLPSELLSRLTSKYHPHTKESDETAYYLKFAGDSTLPNMIQKEITGIVRGPATIQSAKGLFTAGPGQSLRYAGEKVSKWWRGSSK